MTQKQNVLREANDVPEEMLAETDTQGGSLRRTSNVRPNRLFTAHPWHQGGPTHG